MRKRAGTPTYIRSFGPRSPMTPSHGCRRVSGAGEHEQHSREGHPDAEGEQVLALVLGELGARLVAGCGERGEALCRSGIDTRAAGANDGAGDGDG